MSFRDLVHEARIVFALLVLRAGFALTLKGSASLKRLVATRSQEQVTRMEKEKGLS